MEAEIGRLDVSTHRAERGNRTVYNAKVDLFPKVGPKEMHHTACYDGLELRRMSKAKKSSSKIILMSKAENRIKAVLSKEP